MLDPDIEKSFSRTQKNIDELQLLVSRARLNLGFGSGQLTRDHRDEVVPEALVHAFVVSVVGTLSIEGTSTRLGHARIALDGRAEMPRPLRKVSYGELSEIEDGEFRGQIALPRVMVQNLAVGIRDKDQYQLKFFASRKPNTGRRTAQLRAWDLIGFAGAIDL